MTDLILGTAQFGPGYGITNNLMRISDEEVSATLFTAVNGGIRIFDTADGYGDAQERVGRLMPAHADVAYISKFTLDEDPTPESLFGLATQRLKVDRLESLLVHHADDLANARFPQALALVRHARLTGQIGHIGVSVYDENDLDRAEEFMPDLSVVQIPGSVVDRRLLDAPRLRELKASGVKIHVRSAFLQGLLLSPADSLSARFSSLRPVVVRLDSVAKEREVSRLALVLGFLKFHSNVDAVVVGATSHRELASIIDAWDASIPAHEDVLLEDLSLDIIDPRRW